MIGIQRLQRWVSIADAADLPDTAQVCITVGDCREAVREYLAAVGQRESRRGGRVLELVRPSPDGVA